MKNQTINVNMPAQKQTYGLPALCSFFIPGLGQLLKGQILRAIVFFAITIAGYFLIFPGIIFHIWAIVDAYNKQKK